MRNRDIEIYGQNFNFHGHEDHYLDHLVSDGEQELKNYIEHELKPSSVILDIGANIGYFSILCAAREPLSNVYAIEPGELNYKFLTENIQNNDLKNIKPFNYAISNMTRQMNFFENSAWGYIDETNITGKTSLTSVLTLDDFVEKLDLEKIDLIKIDTEGFESHIFEGGLKTINKFKPKIIFEFNTFCMLAYGKRNPIDFMELIKDNFKNIYRFKKDPQSTGDLLEICSRENLSIEALHNNIVYNGSVDNYLVYN